MDAPTTKGFQDLGRFSTLVDEQIQNTMTRAMLITATLGLVGCIPIFIINELGFVSRFDVPGYWALTGGLLSLLLYFIIRTRSLNKPGLFIVFLIFGSIPSIIYLVSWIILPAGPASYITGPPSYLYLVTTKVHFAWEAFLNR